jgi:hypothetical protein
MRERPHHPECLCVTCERTGGGYFAQRAALAGDASAKDRLSPAVYDFLANERAERLAERRRAFGLRVVADKVEAANENARARSENHASAHGCVNIGSQGAKDFELRL